MDHPSVVVSGAGACWVSSAGGSPAPGRRAACAADDRGAPRGQRTRRPRPIGPFFLIAVVLSAGIFIWQKRQNAQQAQNAPPPVIEHQVIGGGNDGEQVVPRPDLVMDRAADLKLSPAQRRQLEPLIARYRKEAAPLNEQLALEQDRWARVDVEAMSKDRPTGQQITEHMARYSELSGRLTRLRVAYWPQVEQLLSAWQRHQVDLLWVSELRGQPLPRRSSR